MPGERSWPFSLLHQRGKQRIVDEFQIRLMPSDVQTPRDVITLSKFVDAWLSTTPEIMNYRAAELRGIWG